MLEHPRLRRPALALAPVALAALLLVTPAITRASGVDFNEIAPMLVDAAPDSSLVMVPPRSMDDVARDQADAEAAARAADETVVLTRGLAARSAAQVEVKKSEVDNLKARVKVAKESKNEAEQKDLERQQKELELAQKRLERIRDMRGAELDLAQAQKAAAASRAQVHQAERALLDLRGQLDQTGATAPSTGQLEKFLAQKRDVSKAETRVLELTKELAGKRTDVASKAKDLADRRLAVIAIDAEIAARKK